MATFKPVCSICAPFDFRTANITKSPYSVSPERDAENAMFFVFNSLSSSQAGCREFDPRLPLHHYNSSFQLPEILRIGWLLALSPSQVWRTLADISGAGQHSMGQISWLAP
jgi:hypothetical protein